VRDEADNHLHRGEHQIHPDTDPRNALPFNKPLTGIWSVTVQWIVGSA
jgi:hypothetical protein